MLLWIVICYKDTGGWRVDDPKGKCSSIPVDVYPLPCTQSRNPEEKEVAQQKGLTEVEAVHSPEGEYAEPSVLFLYGDLGFWVPLDC